MIWGDVKLAALRKLDPSIENLNVTRNTKDYLNSIVEAANRGLYDLATAGKFITKEFRIINGGFANLVPEQRDVATSGGKLEFEAKGQSYYFEVYGPATVTIEVAEVVQKTLENADTHDFVVYRGNLQNEEKEPAKLKIESRYPYTVRNVAIYEELFQTDDAVPAYAKMLRFNLKELAEDFFKLAEDDIVLEGLSPYRKFRDYYWEGAQTLVIPREQTGTFLVHYYAYPREITQETSDDFELVLDPEVAAILPVYIASELMVDDDGSVANYFREQYELAKANLTPSRSRSKSEFINEKGW